MQLFIKLHFILIDFSYNEMKNVKGDLWRL